MKKDRTMILGIVALSSVVVLAGCGRKSESEPAESPGVMERTGAALDTAAGKTVETGAAAADKTADAAKATAAAAKEVTGKVVEKTGDALEKAGDAVERAGASMREPPEPVTPED